MEEDLMVLFLGLSLSIVPPGKISADTLGLNYSKCKGFGLCVF